MPASSSARWACSFPPTCARCCCARAQPCELAELSYERAHQLFQTTLASECPKILYAIGAQLSKRLLDTSRKATRLAFLDVTGRIVRTLSDLCQEPDALSHPQGTQIRVLAPGAGAHRRLLARNAGRVLKQLQIEGKLHARGKTVVVYGTR
jgi:CRP/FNR family cyclic AMP-dependent transcriptional regulator